MSVFCIDIGRSFTIKASMNEAKFDALGRYSTTPLFTDAERAVLDYVTERQKERRLARRLCSHVRLLFKTIKRDRLDCCQRTSYNMTNIGLNFIRYACDIGEK
jgi:hypothetical protein